MLAHTMLLIFVAIFLCFINVGSSTSNQKTAPYFRHDGSRLSEHNITISELPNLISSIPPQELCIPKPPDVRDPGTVNMLLYSPKKRVDIKIAHKGSKTGWTSSELRKLVVNGFNFSQPSLIYVHAYTQNFTSEWLLTMRQLYDKAFPLADKSKPPSFNLIFYDWSDYSLRDYRESISWLPEIGRIAADFLNILVAKYKYNSSRIHLIGYSMSTHIVGIIGRQVDKLGQITALDPSGLCFQTPGSRFSNEIALKSNDAQLVVARHNGMFGMGSFYYIGDVDIIVNGGRSQPGNGQTPYSFEWLGWNHYQASVQESQTEDGHCFAVAYSCRSYSAFLAGECGDCGASNDQCYYINNFGAILYEQHGIAVRSRSGYKPGTKMYIKTGPNQACLYHYQVVVQLKSDATSDVRNSLRLKQIKLKFLGESLKVKPHHQATDNKYTALAVRRNQLREVRQIIATMNSSSELDLDQFGLAVENIEVNFMSHAIPEERERLSARYCWFANRSVFAYCDSG